VSVVSSPGYLRDAINKLPLAAPADLLPRKTGGRSNATALRWN